MRTKKVLLDYSGFKDDELNTLTGKVLACLNSHVTFTDLPVDLAVLKTQTSDFSAKWQIASRGGSRLEIAEKNDAKQVLANSLREIAFYVNKLAKGSYALLLSSGLQIEADTQLTRTPDQVVGVLLKDGRHKGQLDVVFAPLKGSYLYEYEIAEELDEQRQPIWKYSFQTGNSKFNVFAPTLPDVTYYLRVRARNKRGIGDWSDVASLRAR